MTIKALYPTVRPTLNLDFAKTKVLDPRVTFTRASTATFVGSNGLIQTAASGVARFDHNPATGESLGLLVEEARTNIATYSTDFSQAVWTKSNSTITANAATAPDGTLTASLLLPNSGSSPGGEISRTGTNGIFSIYVKRQNARYCGFTTWGFYGGNVYFDLDTGTVVPGWDFHAIFGTVTFAIVSAGNGWYRISITATTSSNNLFRLFPAATGVNGNPPTGDGTSGIYIWGGQIEASATFPTSYIPTTTATVTRAADVASIAGTNFSSWYNQSLGTLLSSGIIPPNSTDTIKFPYFARIGTSSSINNSISFVVANNNSVESSAIQNVGMSHGNISGGTAFRNAISYNQSAATGSSSLNGTILTASSTGQLTTYDVLNIGQNNSDGRYFWNSTIARIAYYPVRLPDAQLQALTAT